jgi:hypothetical protein
MTSQLVNYKVSLKLGEFLISFDLEFINLSCIKAPQKA